VLNDGLRQTKKGCDISALSLLVLMTMFSAHSTGLYGRNDGYRSWYKDQSRVSENMFFKRHYPCYSFVVISEKGEYLSYFGKFPKELVWKAVVALTD
jgi:hypothetical protein